MGGWDFDSKGGTNSAKIEFTKFPEGITKIRIIDSEPTVRWTHWIQKWQRSINCPGKGCAICEIRKQEKANKMPYTYAMGKRLAMNIINRETGKAEVMEQGSTFFKDLRDVMTDLKADSKKLIDADLKVRRRGKGKDDTTYRIDVNDVSSLSKDDEVMVEAKPDLNDFFKPHTSEQILRIVQGEAWDDVMKREEEIAPADETEEDIEIR